MSGTDSPHRGLTRRSFLKASGAAAGALGLAGAVGMTTASDWLAPSEAHAEVEEQVRYCYHKVNCGGQCSMACTVRDGRLVMIEPNKWADKRISLVCLKGLSEVERIYNKDRLQKPLKRVGERGAGEFVEITWDEAYETIVSHVNNSLAQYGPQSVFFYASTSTENVFQFLPKLLGVPAVRIEDGIDMGIANGFCTTTGFKNYGMNGTEITSWPDSNMVILLGHNFLETTLSDAAFFMDAVDAGTKIVTIDPLYTTTAQKSTQWIPIQPGTDAALLLAIMSQILKNRWYDEAFLRANTSAPFLVSPVDGTQLRQIGDTGESDQGDGGDANLFMVWDELSGSLQPYNAEGIMPALEATVEVDGIEYETVFSKLLASHEDYTLEWASEKTTIPINVIEDLAKEYATGGPAILSWGVAGPDKWSNSDIVGHTASILGALTGNFGIPGGGTGTSMAHSAQHPATRGSWKGIPSSFVSPAASMTAAAYPQKDNPVRVMIGNGNIIQQMFPNMHRTVEWIKKLDFIVIVDAFHCPSVDYADIVLPACTCFECEGEYRSFTTSRNHAVLAQKVIEPLFDSRSDFRIEHDLCELFGFGEYVPSDATEFIKALLDTTHKAFEGITLETLAENNCLMRLNVPTTPAIAYVNQQYGTTSKKLEIYHEKMYKHGQALPTYAPQSETEDDELRAKYPLQFSQTRGKYRVHSQFANSSWIAQHDGTPVCEMNPVDAEERGLENGDIVRVFNDRGECKLHCRVLQSQRAGQVRIQEGWWEKFMVEGNLQYLTNDYLEERQYDLPYGPVIPLYDTLVQVEKA